MINLTKEEFSKFRKVTTGGFGTIYEHDGKIYKLYNEKVKTGKKEIVDNPMRKHLSLTKWKLNRLISLRDRIVHTDLIEDTFSIDDYFGGSIMIYYEEAPTFVDLKDKLPLQERIPLGRQFVRNAKELTDHHIYSLDHKLDNVMVVNGEVKLIDLDDYNVRVPLIMVTHYLNKSIDKVDMTIKAFTGEYDRSVIHPRITLLTARKGEKWYHSYSDIMSYLDRKEQDVKLLLVDPNFDLSDSRLIDNRRVTLVYEGSHSTINVESVVEKIRELNSRGIEVYEVIYRKDMDKLINNTVTSECVYVEKGSVLVLK